MGNYNTINKINYQDMQYAINNNFIIINTLEESNQKCLIKNTLSIKDEIEKLNNKNLDKNSYIIIYGENSIDNLVIEKYNQLIKLGFTSIYIYIGGLFEWLLLQDIYGNEYFPTTSEEVDIIQYTGICKFSQLMIKN